MELMQLLQGGQMCACLSFIAIAGAKVHACHGLDTWQLGQLCLLDIESIGRAGRSYTHCFLETNADIACRECR